MKNQAALQQARPATTNNLTRSTSGAAYMGGMGILAALGAQSEPVDALGEFKALKLNNVEKPEEGNNPPAYLIKIKVIRGFVYLRELCLHVFIPCSLLAAKKLTS